MRISPGKWKMVSTGELDLEKAKVVAKSKYDDLKYRTKYNLAPDTRRFADVANQAIKEMQNDFQQQNKFYHYIGALEKYHIPFFGSTFIDNIDHSKLLDFDQWRINKFGRVPNNSTIKNHNAAMNRVFQTGLRQNFILEYQIPKLSNNGLKTVRRPAMNLIQYTTLYRFMRKWSKTGHKKQTRMIREILRDKVLILANTGIREGTECDFSWSAIRTEKDNGYEFTVIHVDGKTGPRDLVANPSVKKYLNRIKQRNKNTKPDDLVFQCRDGTVVKNWHGPFEILMKESGLLKDRDGNNRTLYSLRHTYATFKILYAKLDLHRLAKQMSTSIKMLELHYSHLEPIQAARDIIGIDLIRRK